MISRILLFLLWYFVWSLLSWPPSPNHLAMGVIVAAFVTFMTHDMFQGKPSNLRKFGRYIWFGYYVIVFLWQCFKANIDVAYRVIHPDLPIRPGTVRVKTSLRSDVGLTFLANSITLTPGTTSVDVDKDKGILYVHMLYLDKKYDKANMKLGVVDKFENILRRIFE
jgi:multicomponent Na+:H+ antiporter subunit E